MVAAGAILNLFILIIGSIYFPDNIVMFLASTTSSFLVFRYVLMAVLGVLFLVKAFHVRPLKPVLALASIVMASWTLYSWHMYTMQLLDLLVLLQVAIVFALTSLELHETKEKIHPEEDKTETQGSILSTAN